MTTVPCLFICVLAVTLAGCDRPGDAPGRPGGGRGALPPADVKTIALAPKPMAATSEYVATIRSLRSTTIQPQVEGFLRKILVKAGDHVRAGQPLAQIDPDKQQANIAVTRSTEAAREADVAFAKQQLDRMQKLFDGGAVSRQELEQAETAYKTTQAQLAAVSSQIRESQVQLAYYRLTAPAAGIVGDIVIREGDRVTQSTLITTIDQAEGFEAYINVPLERSAELKSGLTVELLASDGGLIASSPITFIAPRADDKTQSVLVKTTLKSAPSTVRVMQ